MKDFAQALLDPGRPCPPGLRAWNGSDPGARFDVYRNNVIVSLVGALTETFPVVRELVGEAFFATMARHFVAAMPPASPVLTEYGDGFADFVAGYAPAAGVPYLADMARLERARVRAFHAADAPPLQAQHIAARLDDPEALPASRPRLHPSVAALRSRHAIVSLWAAHQGGGEISDVDPFVAESALVLRADDTAAVLRIPEGCARFVECLAAGATFADAVDSAGAAARAPAGEGTEVFDLAASLGLLIRHGAIVGWTTPGPGRRGVEQPAPP